MADSMIGRESERQAAGRCLDGTLAGRGGVLLITGEAGIGKSALVQHIAAEAAGRGMGVCTGECSMQDAGVPYLGFQRALSGIVAEDIFSLEEFAHLDEAFLISNIGLLIAHVSRAKDGGMDEDILGSMLTAVQDFVKDSFGGQGAQKGGLGKLEYMDTKIFIEHGETAFLAAVSSGQEHPDMKGEIRRCLADVESRYFDLLADWDGDVDALSGSVPILESLVARDFRVRRSLESVNIESERLKVHNRMYEAIREKAADAGLLLVLEDVHWADESTVMAIPFIARNIPQDRVLLCLTCRADELAARPDLSGILESASTGPGSAGISLGSLDGGSLRKLVTGMLGGGSPPEDLMADLEAETQGNPFFAIEAVKALLAEGALAQDGGVWVLRRGPREAIPHNVVELVSRRLESLDLDCLRLVEYGAILGRRFSRPMLASGFRMSPEHVSELSARLVSLGLFAEAGAEVMFQHSKVQEVIYAGMSDRWKRAAHRNAGLALESMCGASREDALFDLAYHFSRTMDYDRGIEYCIAAGHKAGNNFAPREAGRFIGRAIEMMEEVDRKDARYVGLNQTLGELFELDGDYPTALSVFDKVLAATGDGAAQAAALMAKGRVLQAQGLYDDAVSCYEKGANSAEGAGHPLLRARINGFMGKVFLRKGLYDKALELQNAYLAESRKSGDARDIGQAFMNLGGVFYHQSNYEAAISNWTSALEQFEACGHTQGIAFVNDNLGVGYLWLGMFDKALEHYSGSERIMARIGDVRGMSTVLLNIGVLYDRKGEPEKSLGYYMRSLQIKKRIGDSVGTATIYNNIGGAYFDLGRYDEAVEIIALNLEMMERFEDTWGICQALKNLAEARLQMGDADGASVLFERAIAMSSAHNFKDILSSSLRLKGVVASMTCDFETADRIFGISLDLALETEDPQRIGETWFSMADSLASRGDREKAVDCYSRALKVFEESRMETLARKVRRRMQAVVDSQDGRI